jgi:formyltetrahydrofolate dehydrogenase
MSIQIEMHVNNMDVRFPNQLFINGTFVDSESKRTLNTINPHDESVICAVARGTAKDVDAAVTAAKVSARARHLHEEYRRRSTVNGV